MNDFNEIISKIYAIDKEDMTIHNLRIINEVTAMIELYKENKLKNKKNYLFKVWHKVTKVELKVYGTVGSTFLVWSNDLNRFVQIFYDECEVI